ncbi:hypothetical protein [Microcoleus anatoxicus]|uniref:Uncharacterized protein n=1 Tax=Microcoleus anatoxicus PTRS2 TaxID=2705321 RepID=A0ABU8YK91_9CYAN
MTKPQHYEVFLTDAIAHYQKGDLTAKGLLHFYFKIRLKDGWTLKETQKDITDKLGISRAAFYSAISKLKAEGSINWSAPANTKFSFSLNSINSESTIEDDLSTIVDSQSTIVDSQSTIVDNESTIVDSASFIVTEEKPEAKQDKGLRKPSYSYSDFLSTFISSLSSDAEREIFENFCLEAASRMPTQPTLISRWMEVNAKSLIEEYQLRVVRQRVILKDDFDYEVNSNSGKCSANSPTVENEEKVNPSW